MNTKRIRSSVSALIQPLLVSCALILSLGAGCAERAPEINTVQPNHVSKSIFNGEWYFQQTITDVAPEASLGFSGYEAGLEKIRWEITEDMLYALQSYEPIIGLNESATRAGATEYAEGVIAAYPIISHFDIRRDYNTSTGEQSNVTSENTIDRPWREREYMRIDWGGNLTEGPAGVSFVWSNSAGRDFVREHERFDPDHLIVDEDRIQFTTQATIADQGRTCFFVYGVSSCGDSEVRVRTSIYRVKPEDAVGFKPLSYPDYMKLTRLKGSDELCPHSEYSPEFVSECEYLRTTSFGLGRDSDSVGFACTPEFSEQANNEIFGYTVYDRDDSCGIDKLPIAARFGFFRTERFGYDRQLGGDHDSRRFFFANHHNIWRDEERTHPRPIIYYTNPGYPTDLEVVTSELANEWDSPFIESAQLKTGTDEDELRATLIADAEAEGVKPWMFLNGDRLRAGALFQVRRNTCSTQGIEDYRAGFRDNPTVIQRLDTVIEEASAGAGVLPGNLLKVCAGIRHMSRAARLKPIFDWQQLGDLRYSFINWVFNPQPSGPLGYGPSSVDPETGRILKGNANVYGASVDTYARSAADIVRAMNEDLSLSTLLSGAHYREWLESSPTVDLSTQTAALTAADVKVDEQVTRFDVESAYGAYRDAQGEVDTTALRKHLRRRLAHPHEHDPLHKMSDLPPVAAERLAKLRADPRIRARALSEERLALLRPLYGLTPEDPIPAEVEERALDLLLNPAEAFDQAQRRTQFFAKQNMLMADFVDDSVIGLALSLKGLDSEEVYRILREEIYRAVMLHEIGHTLGLTHNFSASFDSLNFPDRFWEIYNAFDTREERARARISEFRYTSIMDYGSRFNSDLNGLGKYDHAAIKFVYSGELYTEEYIDEVPPAIDYEVLVNGYEAIPTLLDGDFNKLKRRRMRPLSEIATERVRGLLSNSQVIVDDIGGALAAAGFSDAEPLEYEGLYYFDQRVPYNYCADFYNGNLDCKTWDEGASHFDVVSGAIQNYWNYYIFNHYRQGRSERSFIGSYNGREGRLGTYISYPFRFFYFYQNYDLNLRQDLYRASVASLNFISQVLGAPEPGKHCWDEDRELYRPARHLDSEARASCEDRLDVPLGVGRPFKHQFSDEYDYQIDVIGSFMSKYNLLFYLTDTSSQFFRIANVGDTRAFSIGYYRVYQEELIKLVRSLVISWLDEGSSAYNIEGDATVGDSFNYVLRQGAFEPRALAAADQLGQSVEELETLARVEAPISYDLAWSSVLLNTVFNTSTYDGRPDFSDYIVIAEMGSGEDRTIQEDRDIVTFTHPHTGVIYRAAQTVNGLSIGHEVLRRANLVLSEEWEPAQAALESDPEDAETQARFARAERRIGRYSDLIQDLRVMRDFIDYYDD